MQLLSTHVAKRSHTKESQLYSNIVNIHSCSPDNVFLLHRGDEQFSRKKEYFATAKGCGKVTTKFESGTSPFFCIICQLFSNHCVTVSLQFILTVTRNLVFVTDMLKTQLVKMKWRQWCQNFQKRWGHYVRNCWTRCSLWWAQHWHQHCLQTQHMPECQC